VTTRIRVPREEDFGSRLRSAAVAARLGMWLGVAFTVCFLTGLVSHYAQDPAQPLGFPIRPVWGYRLTQGLHVVAGYACVPLLLVKLWSVFPRLFARPPRELRRLGLHLAERASIGALVAAAVFQLATGAANAAQWYPWTTFSFRATHYAVAWVAIGALVVHVAVKLPVITEVLHAGVEATGLDRAAATEPGVLSRRGLLHTAWLAAGVAVVATAGASLAPLRRVSVLATRSGTGPGGVPINKSARAAAVTATATAASYRLSVAFSGAEIHLTRADLEALPQRTVTLPIACVEGWSAEGVWTGPTVRDVLHLAGAPAGRDVRVESLQPSGPFRVTILQAGFADDEQTLLALDLGGEPLSLDHGYPCRVIAPNRPGVLQTKWVSRLEAS
jgi:hypothetical protein